MESEIILTGNELLLGKITDTNGKWIIDHLLPYGVRISQITIIPDDLLIIKKTIQEALARNPDYIFTSGGLGPTFDDITLEGIALGLNIPVKLEDNLIAKDMMIKRFKRAYPNRSYEKVIEKNPYLLKMIHLPIGTKPLYNSAGTAPGVYFPPEITNKKTIIVSFPGIPNELETLFTDHIIPEIKEKMISSSFVQCGFFFQNIGESMFTQKIYEIKDNYPDIWLKTHPRKSKENQWVIELHITSFSEDPQIKDQMKEVYNILKNHVLNTNGKILEENEIIL